MGRTAFITDSTLSCNAEFIDMAPLLIRYDCVYVITLQICKSLVVMTFQCAEFCGIFHDGPNRLLVHSRRPQCVEEILMKEALRITADVV